MEDNKSREPTLASQHNATIERCTACREIIQCGANVCPHCGKTQHPSLWAHIVLVLKWVGGATAVVSLLSTAINLFQIMGNQHDRDLAVERYLLAAERLLLVENPVQALHQLDEALKLNPNHPVALERETEYVMKSLRRLSVSSGGDKVETLVVKATPLLERMIGSKNQVKTADAMAHLAWNYYFNYTSANKDNGLTLIGPLLARSIEMDKSNVYANMFWANLCLGTNIPRMNVECGDDDLKTAKILWDTAEKSGREKNFVFETKLEILSVMGGLQNELYFFETLATADLDAPSHVLDNYRKNALVKLWNTALKTPDALLDLGLRLEDEALYKLIVWARASEEPMESINSSVREWHLERRNALDTVSAELQKQIKTR